MPENTPALDRRQFLKWSLASSLVLSVGSGTLLLSGCAPEVTPAEGMGFLSKADQQLFAALLPAIVSQGLPSDPAALNRLRASLFRALDDTCMRLHVSGQKNLRQLLDLLHGALTRRWVAGVNKPWAECSVAEVQAFLARWQRSSLSLLNAGYVGLVKLVCSSHYSQPTNALKTGYPGPLAWAYVAANS